MRRIGDRTEVADEELGRCCGAWAKQGREHSDGPSDCTTNTYTGAGPFLRTTRMRTHSSAKRRQRAHGSFATSGWSGGTSGDGSQRRLEDVESARRTTTTPGLLTCPYGRLHNLSGGQRSARLHLHPVRPTGKDLLGTTATRTVLLALC